jgi:predicted nucleotidyltransferase
MRTSKSVERKTATMRPSVALSLHRTEMLQALSRYKVKNPRVFGSVARGDDDEESDIDLLVDSLPGFTLFQYGRQIEYLESITGTKVDVVTTSSIDDNPRFLGRVTKEAVPLSSSDSLTPL